VRIFVSAGEASGDALGAHLLDALSARVPELSAFGLGGPMMTARGFDARHDAGEVGVVGLVEILRHLPRLFRLVDALAALAIAERPDVAVLIDVPDFNIRLAERLHAAGIPVVFYVGPSVWAWRPGRARRYARHIDRLLVLFPFELPIWQRAGVDVVCVGHPLIDELPAPRPTPPEAARTVTLMPGSRRGELERHLGTLLEAAALLVARGQADRFVLPVAPTLDAEVVRAEVERSPAAGRVELVLSPAGDPTARRRAIESSAVAMVASGTATLEVALLGRPQVVVYRVSWLTWCLIRPLVRVAFLGLVNLIAGREVAPELLQGRFRASQVADAVGRLLADAEARAIAVRATEEIRGRLGDAGAAARAAEAVIALVERGRGAGAAREP
jgi:lipid-A-disaccharide synthase